MTCLDDMTLQQRNYLEGFVSGLDANRQAQGLPTLTQSLTIGGQTIANKNANTPTPQDETDLHRKAQNRFLTQGKKLSNEEKAKRQTNGLDIWEQMRAAAREGQFPKGTDVFLYKFQGMFFVAPAQNSFMCRMRFPGGLLNAHQMKGIADLADQYGGGYTHVTTRANLQLREIKPADPVHVLTSLADLGVIIRGSGGDNVRNITASPTAGIDTQEWIDTRSLAREIHHEILNRRELHGLPRKFNIAFDGGGTISSLAETNDIGFAAVRLGKDVGFRLELGGITGHKDFARDTGIMLSPEQCTPVATAILQVFIEHGDRTDRRKARLKYLLDDWGFEKFLQEVQTHLPFTLAKVDRSQCEPRGPINRLAHVGFHPQSQEGKHYVGVVLPVGKLTSTQMRDLAAIANQYGSGSIRLTVWQNLLISGIATENVPAVKAALEQTGLHWSANQLRAGLVACTGKAGCKFGAADTKAHAMQIIEKLETRIELDQPLNIHLTGCHHSCAQHYIGDIGLQALPLEQPDGHMAEGYRLFVGGGTGGTGGQQKIGREILPPVQATQLPQVLEQMLQTYHEHRHDANETFYELTARQTDEELQTLFSSSKLTELVLS